MSYDVVMARRRAWTDEQLRALVPTCTNFVMLLERLGLTSQSREPVRRRLGVLGISTQHFSRAPNGRGRPRGWSDDQLAEAVSGSQSIAGVIRRLGLIPAGGNYDQVQRRIRELALDISHFTGTAWNRGGVFVPMVQRPLEELLVANRPTSSHGLKKRLFRAGLKEPRCELCGWAERAPDGRIPVELDHINGDKNDNRLENLRILCPNCHALQPTHRGLNKKSLRS